MDCNRTGMARSLGLAALVSCGLTGCMGYLGRLPPLPGDEPLAVVVAPEANPNLPITISNPSGGGPATIGAIGGGAAGLAAAAACGWFVVVCAPYFVLAGGAAGGGAGGVVGHALGLPRDSRESLDRRVEAHVRSHPPHQQLAVAVAEKTKTRWKVVDESPRATLAVELSGITLASDLTGNVVLKMRAIVALRTVDANGDRTGRVQQFEYESPETALDLWVAEDFDYVSTAFGQAYATIAERVVAELSR